MSYTVLNDWTKWYAWFPVRLRSGQLAWRRTVEYERVTVPICSQVFTANRTVTNYREANP